MIDMVKRTAWAASALLACHLLGGCGGLTRERIFEPRAPLAAVSDQDFLRGEEEGTSWVLTLEEAQVRVFPVVVSSKLLWVFGPLFAFPTFWEAEVQRPGPLKISLFLAAEPGAAVGLNASGLGIVLADGRSLPPVLVAPWPPPDTEPVPVARIELVDGEEWRGFIQFDIPLADLTPFVLRLGVLEVNGTAVALAEIPFTADRLYR